MEGTGSIMALIVILEVGAGGHSKQGQDRISHGNKQLEIHLEKVLIKSFSFFFNEYKGTRSSLPGMVLHRPTIQLANARVWGKNISGEDCAGKVLK